MTGPKIAAESCKNNTGLNCTGAGDKCHACGWNSAEHARRIKAIPGRFRYKDVEVKNADGTTVVKFVKYLNIKNIARPKLPTGKGLNAHAV